ncbi:MAG TPA: FAD-dependent oxidoreductase [Mycobacterium sp.]|jgi:glycine/D-amino acid oxidase-like deaminating enzyme|nr:FAD-dependent oxidoreductase [Mycobacterium sp.]
MRAVIIGAGIVGCAVARELSAHGVTVDIVDRGAPGAATTAHCEGNILVSDKGPGPELALQQLSRRLWPGVLSEIRDDCGADATDPVEWEPKGGIVVATTSDGADGLTRFAAGQTAAGVTAHAMTADDAHAAEPYLTRDFTAAYHYPDDAQVQPVAATFALLRGALHHGARVHPGVTVTGPVLDSGALRGVATTAGAFTADVVIDCAGPWAAKVSEILGAPIAVKPRRGNLLVTTPQPPTVFHKVYDADYVGAVGSDDAGLQTSTVVEATRGGPLLIGSSRERVPLSAGISMASLEEMARKAIRLFPHLAGVQVMRAYGGFRPYVDDHLPVIGADPRLPGLWHATGHEGGGIGLAVGTAALLRALLLDHQLPMAADDFRVDRPALIHAEEVSP